MIVTFGFVIIPILPVLFTDLVCFLIVTVILVLVSLVFFGIRYVIDDKTLYVKGFLFTEKIDIDKITEITSSKSWISAPAASLDRMEIKYKNGAIIISPANKKEFIEDLCKVAKGNIIVKI